MVEVLCIGHASYDISLFLESFPEENIKSETTEYLEGGGGPAANAAYLLTKWGISCGFAGLIGEDRYGINVIEEFKSAGTDISCLEVRENYSTPLSIIMVNKSNGSRTIINRKSQLSNMNVNIKALGKLQPKVLLFDGHELNASLEAMKIYPDAQTILDAGSLRDSTRILAQTVDYLVASERFAASFSEVKSLDVDNYKKCFNNLAQLNESNVVITLGEKGLLYSSKGDVHHMSAFKADVLDTTGAGDVFHGTFVYGVLKGMEYEKTLELASIAAAMSVQVRGARNSIPDLNLCLNKLNNIRFS